MYFFLYTVKCYKLSIILQYYNLPVDRRRSDFKFWNIGYVSYTYIYIYICIKPGVLICLAGFYRVINLSSNRDRLDNGVYGQGYHSQCEATRDYIRAI